MIKIAWKPSPKEMRDWALAMGVVLPIVGALFYFLDWGVFSGKQGFGIILWCFAAFAFATGITGSRIGLPAYWLWMGVVFLIGSVIGIVALSVVFFLMVVPMAFLGRIMKRDQLQLSDGRQTSYWRDVSTNISSNPQKQF